MRLLFTSFVLLVLMNLPINAFSQSRTNTAKLTNEDKSEILVGVITDSVDELMSNRSFDQCTIPIVDGRKVLLINTDLPMESGFHIGEFSFRVKSRKEIEREIKDNNGDCYFAVSPLSVINVNKVMLTIWRHINVVNTINGKSLYPSRWIYGVGRTYEGSRVGGRWSVKYLRSTSIVS
jgi:hypothetical protein